MGTDIHGAIEVRPSIEHRRPIEGSRTPDDTAATENAWTAVDTDALAGVARNYDVFGCLFGVRNLAGFDPIAPDRGLPADADQQTRDAAREWEGHNETWITWAQLADVDWDERAVHTDQRVQRYEWRTEDPLDGDAAWRAWPRRLAPTRSGALRPPACSSRGVWAPTTKAVHDSAFAAHCGVEGAADGSRYPEGTTWRVGNTVYRVRRLRRREALAGDPAWQAVFDRMRGLTREHEPEHVRLVVWFDS